MTWSLPPFLWGVATSAYQIEGGITGNDWAEWEQYEGARVEAMYERAKKGGI